MEANLSTNCSMTNNYLIRILGPLGAISVVTCFVALIWLFYLKLYKAFLYRLAAYQVVASLFHGLLLVSQLTFLEYNESEYPSCVAVAYLFQTFAWIKTCLGCWITFHLFCFAVLLKNMRKLEPLYVISSILFPIAISFVPLITKTYGPTGEWCWIQKRKTCGKNYIVGEIEQIALWYGPAFVLLVLQSAAMLAMMITVYYRAHKKSKFDENVFGREQNNIAFRQLLPLVAYPVLYCILLIPPFIARVYGVASSTSNEGLLLLTTICLPAWSFASGMTLILHIVSIKRTAMIRVINTLRITEEAPRETVGVHNSHHDGIRSTTYFSLPSDY